MFNFTKFREEMQFLTHLCSTRLRVNYHILHFAIILHLAFYTFLYGWRKKIYIRDEYARRVAAAYNFMQNDALIKEAPKNRPLFLLCFPPTRLLYPAFCPTLSLIALCISYGRLDGNCVARTRTGRNSETVGKNSLWQDRSRKRERGTYAEREREKKKGAVSIL